MGEVEEKTTNSPKIIKTMIGGINHHFLFFKRYSAKSLIIGLLCLTDDKIINHQMIDVCV